jgi:hypothetical protein
LWGGSGDVMRDGPALYRLTGKRSVRHRLSGG